MKLLFKILFSLLIFVISFILVAKIVVIRDIQPPFVVLLFFCTISLPFFCYIVLTELFEYIEILKRRFQLCIEHCVSNKSEIVYYINGYHKTPVPKIETTSRNIYKYSCRGLCINLNKEKAESFFLNPMKPTIKELTIFELCGYSDCIQTFGETYDYSKSFDELFGYYMQEGFINKIKYIIKNRDRLRIGRII